MSEERVKYCPKCNEIWYVSEDTTLCHKCDGALVDLKVTKDEWKKMTVKAQDKLINGSSRKHKGKKLVKGKGVKIQKFAKAFFIINVILISLSAIAGIAYNLIPLIKLKDYRMIAGLVGVVIATILLIVVSYFNYLLLSGYGSIVESSELYKLDR